MREKWDAKAYAWRHWHAGWAVQTAEATRLVIARARITPGMWVLDVASGTGEPALTIASVVGPEGRVVATDLAPAMLGLAAEAARERDLTGFSVAVAPAEDLPFPAGLFDAVTCRFGIAHAADPARALREIYRVLRPGAVAAFVAWGAPRHNPFFGIVDAAFGHLPVADFGQVPAPGGPFTFAQPSSLGTALTAAGFETVEETATPITLRWPGLAEQAWAARRAMSSTIEHDLAALSPHDGAAVEARVIGVLRGYERGGEVVLPAHVVVASGRRTHHV